MGIAYHGADNRTNHVITTDGKLLEIGRCWRIGNQVPTSFNETANSQKSSLKSGMLSKTHSIFSKLSSCLSIFKKS